MSLFYVWVTPAFIDGSWVDHTWVTDYDTHLTPHRSIHAVKANGGRVWLCWGDFHAKGKSMKHPNGLIGSAQGSLPVADCLCKANAYSKTDVDACGTILIYGIDGVCHQLANQVLWATKAPNVSPLVVQKARGYSVSKALYGVYGIDSQAWQQRTKSCAIRNLDPDPQWGVAMLANAPDSFERHAASVLRLSEKLSRLIKLRQQHQANLAELKASVLRGGKMPSAQMLNSLNNDFLRQAAELLGPIDFEKIFEIPAGEVVNLVDPKMLAEVDT
ncbi:MULTISPECIES: hypothetical protein [Pseudomonas]|jgi:hypothetical protein|uniref:hypothetical protein n=1 Tax=Pseudomonas sp. MIL9 TaxID=2807620 RepID=UPI00102A9987|nr:hypothetical protein [Pseudomonas sp. MIL9]MBM6447363.1 hypothetical protein [Pseudomonas sp. MIL9]RZO06519.1 hypothetical protein EKG40_17955 [Pseudomonas moorei]